MPLIEELPTTAVHRVTHGWAYVPDTGPLQIPAVQLGNRKRGAGAGTTSSATASATAKQQKATQQRLDSLDKENYKDGVTVSIPPRSDRKSNSGRKMTSNVRRILTYQRAFAHYLADEEANAQNAPTTISQPTAPTTTLPSRGGTSARRKSNLNDSTTTSTSTPTPATRTGSGGRRGRPPNKGKDKTKSQPAPDSTVKDEDTQTTDNDASNTNIPPSSSTHKPAIAATSTSITSAPSAPSAQPKPPYDPSLDTHPLLRTTDLPKMPSDRVMQLLISEPPLSYTAAQATYPVGTEEAATTTVKPARHFCGVCGYWGRVKCRKCNEWTCGIMECWKGHEAVCPAVGIY